MHPDRSLNCRAVDTRRTMGHNARMVTILEVPAKDGGIQRTPDGVVLYVYDRSQGINLEIERDVVPDLVRSLTEAAKKADK